MEDIFYSEAVQKIFDAAMAEAVDHTEFEFISVDATLKCCLSILGQASLRAGAKEQAEAVFKGKDSFRKAPDRHIEKCYLNKSRNRVNVAFNCFESL